MIQSLINPISSILDKFIPDADEKARLAHEIATMADKHSHEIALAQIEVNKIDQQSQSKFKSWWRPAVAWVCVIAFAWHFVLQPLLVFAFAVAGVTIASPEFDMFSLLTVLGGLLGIGTMRTVEKGKGLTK